jgi:phosphopantetheinyl transferase (holo-ACP synthase)
MKRNEVISSFLEIVALDEVKAQWGSISKTWFHQSEIDELSSRPFQSAAGMVALKRALVRLGASRRQAPGLTEKDFTLSHDESGAPRLDAAPAAAFAGTSGGFLKIRLSLSHTRKFACGLAVLAEESRD